MERRALTTSSTIRLSRVQLQLVIDSGLVGSMGFGRGAARAKDAQGTPTQSHISQSLLVYGDKLKIWPRNVQLFSGKKN